MAIQNRKTSIAKSQSVEDLKTALPDAFEKLEREGKKNNFMTNSEKAFIAYAVEHGYTQGSIAKSLNRPQYSISNYIYRCLK